MAKDIIKITFYKDILDNESEDIYWRIGVLRDEAYNELSEDNINPIKEEFKKILEYAESIKTDEEKEKENTESKLNEVIDIINEKTTDEEKLNMISIYPEWEPSIKVIAGKYVRFENKLYKIIQTHKTQPDWPPDTTHALFTEVLLPGQIGEWKQPLGEHDAYKLGDKVRHKDQIWIATKGDAVGNNIWEPGVYGWEEYNG